MTCHFHINGAHQLLECPSKCKHSTQGSEKGQPETVLLLFYLKRSAVSTDETLKILQFPCRQQLSPRQRAGFNTHLISFYKRNRYLNFQWPSIPLTLPQHLVRTQRQEKQNTSRRLRPSQWAPGAPVYSFLKQNIWDQRCTDNGIYCLHPSLRG